jgi:hypothetical protein
MAASPRVHARSGTVLHLLVLGQQGDRHLLNGNSQPAQSLDAARSRRRSRLGMGGGEAVKLQHDVNVIGWLGRAR